MRRSSAGSLPRRYCNERDRQSGQELAEALEAARQAHFDANGAACDYAALAPRPSVSALAAPFALAGFDIKRAQIPSQLAFWINVFNAGVLRDARELELAGSAREVEAFSSGRACASASMPIRWTTSSTGCCAAMSSSRGARARRCSAATRASSTCRSCSRSAHFALHSACRSSPPLRGPTAASSTGRSSRRAPTTSGATCVERQARCSPAATFPLVRGGFRRRQRHRGLRGREDRG